MKNFYSFLGLIYLVFAIILAACMPLTSQAAELAVEVLPNGLKTGLVQVDSPYVLLELRVGAGFVDESVPFTGVAHWLEHGLFRGVRRFPNKSLFEKELARLGVQYNASTNYERTNYFFMIPKERFAEATVLFADMFAE